MTTQDVVPFLKYTRDHSERNQIVRLLFQEIPGLDCLSISEQERYANEILKKFDLKQDQISLLKAFFELGKLYRRNNSTSRPPGW